MSSLFKGKRSGKSTPIDSTTPPASSASSLNQVDPEDPNLALAPEDLAVPEGVDPASESGKAKQLFSLLRRALHVADLSSLRISLPANLLEPVGNLESWNYCARADYFAAMGDSDDELERMLSVLRWTFTKELRFVKEPIAKPFNSILGEHFHAYYDTTPVTLHPITGEPEPFLHIDEDPSPEVLAAAGRTTAVSSSSKSSLKSAPSSTSISQQATGVSSSSTSTSSASGATQSTSATTVPYEGNGGSTRVVFINEQTSHHPPISHFILESRGPKGTVRCVGADQLSAKFTGTTVKVFPGPHNHGLFVTLPDRANEEYQITHPTANVAGLLRGSPYATICETCIVTCRGGNSTKRYRTILTYAEESWLTKAKFAVEGVIYQIRDESELAWSKIKQVPVDRVVATLTGCWRGEVKIKLAGETTSKTLVDMVPLKVDPKKVAPLSEQDELETRRVWDDVCQSILRKEFNEASKKKQTLEQAQRDKAEARKKSGEPYLPRYFEPEGDIWDGRPQLSAEGLADLEKQFKAQYEL